MGWTIYCTPPSDPKAELIRIIEASTQDGPTFEVVQTSKRGAIFYFAVKITPVGTDPSSYAPYTLDADGTYTIGAVAQTNRYRGEWGYKLTEETQGPVLSDAPISLIERLSDLPMFPDQDTGADWATKWRARCINNTKQRSSGKLSHGDVIEFHEDLNFQREGVGESRKFLIVKEPTWNGRKRTVFKCMSTNTRCRIHGALKRPHTLHKGGAGHG